MKIVKKANKQTVKMSKKEWENIGKKAGWVFSQHLDNVKTLDTLTDREVLRAVRDATIAEQDAIKQYETVVDSTNNEKIKEVLQSIADEEKVHVGELQKLLKMFSDNEEKFLEDGEKEVDSK